MVVALGALAKGASSELRKTALDLGAGQGRGRWGQVGAGGGRVQEGFQGHLTTYCRRLSQLSTATSRCTAMGVHRHGCACMCEKGCMEGYAHEGVYGHAWGCNGGCMAMEGGMAMLEGRTGTITRTGTESATVTKTVTLTLGRRTHE